MKVEVTLVLDVDERKFEEKNGVGEESRIAEACRGEVRHILWERCRGMDVVRSVTLR